MKAKQIIGIIFLITFIGSLGYKLANADGDGLMTIMLVLIVAIVLIGGIGRVLRS